MKQSEIYWLSRKRGKMEKVKELKKIIDTKAIEKDDIKNYIERYSLINNELLHYQAKQEYTDAKGYKQWIDEKRQVKKGEKASYILAPLFYSYYMENGKEQKIKSKKEYQKISKKHDIQKKAYNYKAIPVFYNYQLEDEKTIAIEEKREEKREEKMEKYVEQEVNGTIVITQRELKQLINQVVFSASKDKKRELYTGTLFKIENNILEAVALDGYRVAIRRLELKNNYNDKIEFIIPSIDLKEIGKLCKASSEEVKIKKVENKIEFDINNNKIIYDLLVGEFLDYNKLLEINPETTIEIDRKKLLDALKRTQTITKKVVKLIITENNLNLLASDEVENLKWSENIEVITKGEKMELFINGKYLIDAIKNIKENKITISLATPISPCLITSEENENLVYLILPMRINE